MLRKRISLAYSRRACKLHCHAGYAYVFARKKIKKFTISSYFFIFLHISSYFFIFLHISSYFFIFLHAFDAVAIWAQAPKLSKDMWLCAAAGPPDRETLCDIVKLAVNIDVFHCISRMCAEPKKNMLLKFIKCHNGKQKKLSNQEPFTNLASNMQNNMLKQ